MGRSTSTLGSAHVNLLAAHAISHPCSALESPIRRQGCRTLRAAFDRYDQEELERARERERGHGHGHGRGPLCFLPLPWLWGGGGGRAGSAGAAAAGTRGAAASAGGGGAGAVVAPHFSSCRRLDKVVKPLDRWGAGPEGGRVLHSNPNSTRTQGGVEDVPQPISDGERRASEC